MVLEQYGNTQLVKLGADSTYPFAVVVYKGTEIRDITMASTEDEGMELFEDVARKQDAERYM